MNEIEQLYAASAFIVVVGITWTMYGLRIGFFAVKKSS